MVNPSDDNSYDNNDTSHRNNHKISLGHNNPQSKEILRLVNDINMVRIFASVSEPMTVSDICKKTKISKTTLYRKISGLEELRLLVRKGRSAKEGEYKIQISYYHSYESYLPSQDEFMINLVKS